MITFGIVEDIKDPLRLGRVRVRVFGYHTPNKTDIPTDSLPWAVVVQPTTSSANSGIGQSPRILAGTLVMIVFIDGEDMQEPAVIGTVPSIVSKYVMNVNGEEIERGADVGFQDPNNVYPLSSHINKTDLPFAALDSECFLDEARVNREAGRMDDEGNLIFYRTATPGKVTSVAADRDEAYYGEVLWSEPQPADGQDVIYPLNQVRVSESGITEEWDDTPGSTRHHLYHPSGTYQEIVNDGSRAIKVVGENHEIYIQDNSIVIHGDCNLTVHGDRRDLVLGNYTLEVEGEVNYHFHSSKQEKIGKNSDQEIGLNRSTNIGQNDTLFISGRRDKTIAQDEMNLTNGNYTENIVGDVVGTYNASVTESVATNKSEKILGKFNQIVGSDMSIAVGSNVTMNVAGAKDVNVSGAITEDGATINLNSGTSEQRAARVGDSADNGDGGAAHADGSNVIEMGSKTVFIGGESV